MMKYNTHSGIKYVQLRVTNNLQLHIQYYKYSVLVQQIQIRVEKTHSI